MNEWETKDEFDIDGGEPQRAELLFGSIYLPRMMIETWNNKHKMFFVAKHLPGDRRKPNLPTKMGPDWVIYTRRKADDKLEEFAVLEIERKREELREKLFDEHSTYPLNVATKSFNYNRGKHNQSTYSLKYERIVLNPQCTFFIALRDDARCLLAAWGKDIERAPLEKITASHMAREIEVHRVPREKVMLFRGDESERFTEWIISTCSGCES